MKILTWQNYTDKWPEELTKAQKGLKTDIAKGIYVYLLLSESKAFSEIAKDLELEPNKLAYHLKNLVRYGLLTHEYVIEEERAERSFYRVSNFGNIYAKKVLEAAHSPYQHQDVSVPPISFREKPEEGISFPIDNWAATNEGDMNVDIRRLQSKSSIKNIIYDSEVTTTELVV